jgi:cytochrome c-type biogenesis protein CcmH/NrfG
VEPYEKAAEANPNDSQTWRKLGIVYLKTGQNAQGIQCLEQALRLNPNDQDLKKWLENYRAHQPSKP